MPLDVSLEAIEADLRMAERGGQVGDLAMARAQVRATLLAAQPVDHQGRHEAPETPTGNYITWHDSADIRIEEHPVGTVYLVPSAATWDDRVTAVAMLLKIPHPDLVAALEHLGELTPGFSLDITPVEAPVVEPDPYAGEPDEEDVFAEAKKARKKK